jgi:hypothetical protein
MGALQSWLGSAELASFRQTQLGREAMARPAVAGAALEVCNWRSLGRLLAREPEVWVVARGQRLEMPPPRSLSELRALFERGIGIVVCSPEREDAGLASLCADFARDLPGDQRLLVFATAAGTNGFGWHYDAEDVFVVQVAGDKEYYFRQNSLDPSPRRGAQPDFSCYRRETTPMMSSRLIAGDLLYLPPGYWHVAHPHAHSLSISIGVFPER